MPASRAASRPVRRRPASSHSQPNARASAATTPASWAHCSITSCGQTQYSGASGHSANSASLRQNGSLDTELYGSRSPCAMRYQGWW